MWWNGERKGMLILAVSWDFAYNELRRTRRNRRNVPMQV
jgi:hypothetical protein